MKKRLYRDTANEMLSGVCSGLAEYFGIDATIVRLLWALITLFSAGIGGILAYIICAVVIPEKPFYTEVDYEDVSGR